MGRRSKTRWVLRWAGTLLLVLILGLFISSLWRDYGYFKADGSGYVACFNGKLIFVWADSLLVRDRGDWEAIRSMVRFRPLELPAASYWTTPGTGASKVDLPLWLPFVVVALPTACLWWLDRRRIPPGHCQKCGYDLTGNVSGRCPECATRVPARGTDA